MLLNKDTFERDHMSTPIQGSVTHRCSSWALKGVVVTGKSRMTPDQSCSYFSVTNIHINNESAKRRSVCIALLVLRDLYLKLRAVVLTEDFNKGAENKLTPGGAADQRRFLPLEAAFIFADVPWTTSGVTPLWGVGSEPHGNKWSECCGFAQLPEEQNLWLVMRHGSFNVVPASIGLKSTDKTWHYKLWMHLDFAGLKRRRDTYPSESKASHQPASCMQPALQSR